MKGIRLGKYEHYKGKQYEVVALARPKSMFLETVNIDGKEIPRFRFVG